MSDGKRAAPRRCARVETLERRQTCHFDVSSACARRREVGARAVMSEDVFGLLSALVRAARKRTSGPSAIRSSETRVRAHEDKGTDGWDLLIKYGCDEYCTNLVKLHAMKRVS